MPTKPKNASKDPARDHCQTPDYALEPLYVYLDSLAQREGNPLIVWESAAGEGLMVGYLKNHGYLVHAGDALTGQDYFKATSVPTEFDVEVTNPPGSKKYEWLERACKRNERFALLMPAEVMFAGEKAVPLFEQYGIEILLPDKRVDYKMPNLGWGEGKHLSSATFHSAWLCKGLEIGQFVTYVHILKARARQKYLAKFDGDSRLAYLTYVSDQLSIAAARGKQG